MQSETETVKIKEPKKLTPVQEWDQVAFSLIYQELAPNGFKKIQNGKKEVSAQQFLRKETVKRCQNISAQLIRAYREELRKEIADMEAECEGGIKDKEERLKNTPVLNFKERRTIKETIKRLIHQRAATKHFIARLDHISVPRKQKES